MNLIEFWHSIDVDDGAILGVAFSTNGEIVAAGGTRFVSLFEAKTGRRLYRLGGHSDEVRALAFSPDGKLLASASMDKMIRIWQPDSGKLLKVLRKYDSPLTHMGIRWITFSPDSKMIASCDTTNDITFWDVDAGLWERISWTPHSGCFSLAFSPDGKRCAIAGGKSARNFFGQVSHNELRHGLKLLWHREQDGDKPATHVAYSPRGDQVVSCGQDNQLHIWDEKSGRELHVLTGSVQEQPVVAALFLRKGASLLSVTHNERLEYWDIGSPDPKGEATGKPLEVRGLALSPREDTAATAADEAIHLWRIQTATPPSK